MAMPLEPGPSADDVCAILRLEPHPEGGFYRETFRDPTEVDARAVSSAIYFLLREGEVSRWHRIDATEVWHWYAGSPLELALRHEGKETRRDVLGSDLSAGARPQLVVPANVWQQAKSLGSWSLVGCTVAPGFEFEHFEMEH